MTDKIQNGEFSRRSVLRTGAVAGVLATGAAVGGAVAQSNGEGGKRGGRAQADGRVRRGVPFTITPDGTDDRPATCMAGESAVQTYLTYDIEYCDSDDDESDATLYVIPDEAELVPTEDYIIRSKTPCRRNDLTKVAFGPSNESC